MSLRRDFGGIVFCIDDCGEGASRIMSSTREPEGSQEMSRRSSIGIPKMLEAFATFKFYAKQVCGIIRACPKQPDYAVHAHEAYFAVILHPAC